MKKLPKSDYTLLNDCDPVKGNLDVTKLRM